MRILLVRFILIPILMFIPSIVFAQETLGPYDIAVAFKYGMPIGSEETGYNWSDLYQNGTGGSLEISTRYTPALALHIGIAYDTFSGKGISFFVPPGVGVTGQFSTLNPLSLYIGEKLYLSSLHPRGSSGFVDPYIRVDLGMTSFNSVDFNSNSGSVSVGGSTTAFSYALGVGVDLWTTSSFALLLEAKYHDYGKPGGAGETLKDFPELSLGVRFRL